MDIFYAPPPQIQLPRLELLGQEAVHACRVMRYREGDSLTAVDGEGGWYRGPVTSVGRDRLVAEVTEQRSVPPPAPPVTLALGILRKRDRLEFAVEKAVELGAFAVSLFRSEHTVKENVRQDRLEAAALSAMKQSGRAWLPPVRVFDSLEALLEGRGEGSVPAEGNVQGEGLAGEGRVQGEDKMPGDGRIPGNTTILMAHEKSGGGIFDGSDLPPKQDVLILIGPEGGFSEEETALTERYGAELISLGAWRLRAETAAVTVLSGIPSLRK